MRKILFTILTFILMFVGISGVEAASCYYMLGENNKFVIPAGYTATCFYEYSSSKSNIGSKSFSYLKLVISKDKTTIEGTDSKVGNVSGTSIVSFSNNFSITTSYKSKFNEIDLSNKEFTVVEFDKNINGCPGSIYFLGNGDAGFTDYVVGLSKSDTPSVSYGSGAKKSVYTLTYDSDGDDVYMENNSGDQIFYEKDDHEFYDWYLEDNCTGTIEKNSNNNSTTEQGGSESHAVKEETLATCKYYIGLTAAGECGVVEFDISLIKKTEDGKTTYNYSSIGNGIRFDNVKNAVGTANNGYMDDLYGFFSYSNNKWSCYDTLYSYVDPQTDVATLYGQNKYDDLINNYGEENVKLVTTTKDENCDTIAERKAKERAKDNPGTDVYDCGGLLGPNTLKLLNSFLTFIMILGPIVALILGTYELIVAVAHGEDDDKKKGILKLRNRLIAAALLLLAPYIVKLILNIAGRTDGCIDAIQNASIWINNL